MEGKQEIEIKSKIRNYITGNLDGFDDFKDTDKLNDMGIVTGEFCSDLIYFIQNEFNISITGDDFSRSNFTVTSIAKCIDEKMVEKEPGAKIDVADLIRIFEEKEKKC